MPLAITDNEVITLPSPGQEYDAQKELRTEEFIVTKKTTQKKLRARLEQYGLPARAVLTVFGIGDDLNPAPRKRQHTSSMSHTHQTIPSQDAIHDSNISDSGTPQASLNTPSQVQSTIVQGPTDPQTQSPTAPFNSEVPSHEKDFLLVRMRHVEHNVLSAREDFAQRMDTLEDSISAKLSNLSECIRVSSLAPQTAPTFTATRQSTSCTTSIPNHQHLTASAPLQPVPAPTEVSQPLSTQPLQHDQEDTIPDELRAEAQLGNETFVFNKTE
ncbi:hypothetical protein PAXINDRAFT_99702, partial [Paxillus involutus ATCC 200175]